MFRLGSRTLLFQTAEPRIHEVEMVTDGLRSDWIVRRLGQCLSHIGVSQREDHGSIGDRVIRWTRRARLGSLAFYLTALIEEVLRPGASCDVGNKIEFVP